MKIREYIGACVPGAKHAHLDRTDAIGRNHRIGVEYANEESIILALQNAKATFIENIDKQYMLIE